MLCSYSILNLIENLYIEVHVVSRSHWMGWKMNVSCSYTQAKHTHVVCLIPAVLLIKMSYRIWYILFSYVERKFARYVVKAVSRFSNAWCSLVCMASEKHFSELVLITLILRCGNLITRARDKAVQIDPMEIRWDECYRERFMVGVENFARKRVLLEL